MTAGDLVKKMNAANTAVGTVMYGMQKEMHKVKENTQLNIHVMIST